MFQANYLFKSLLIVACTLIAYFEPIKGAINIYLISFSIDFITGILASFRKGERFKSSKARWSFAKLLCYTGSFMFLLMIAKNLQASYTSHSDYEMLMWVIKRPFTQASGSSRKASWKTCSSCRLPTPTFGLWITY